MDQQLHCESPSSNMHPDPYKTTQDAHVPLGVMCAAEARGGCSGSFTVQTTEAAARAWKHEKPLGGKQDSNKSLSQGRGSDVRELYKNSPPLKTLSCHDSSLYSTL